MEDCSKYIKKFYMGIGVFFIMVISRTFFILPVWLVLLGGLVILIGTLILTKPYLKCLEKNMKKPWQ